MKIGLLTPSLEGVTSTGSGIGVHFRHLAEALVKAGHSVQVVVASPTKSIGENDLPYPVKCIVGSRIWPEKLLGRLNWQLHTWTSKRALIRAAAAACQIESVDIWETTSTDSLPHRFLCSENRAPVVVRVSTTAAQLRITNAGLRKWIDRQQEKWERECVLRAEAIVTHSPSHLRHVAGEFGISENDIGLVPHGIPIPARREVRTSEKIRVLFVGRFEHRKGIDLLMDALPRFLTEIATAEVELVGYDSGNSWQRKWRQIASADVSERVIFSGQVSPARLSDAYRNADIFIAPSRYESFGLIFVEAMAQQLPVIALDAPGARDLVTHESSGLLVGEDPAQICTALLRLARSRELRIRLGENGRGHVESQFSLDELTRKSLLLYKRIAARPR